MAGLLYLSWAKSLRRKQTPATHVLFVMARGLIHEWKMPIAFNSTNKTVRADSIKSIICESVSHLKNLGLDIRAVTLDQGSTNRKAVKLLGVAKETGNKKETYRKVYVMYDFPHLMKSVRNNLMKRNKFGAFVGQISTYDGVADWGHIATLYNLETSSVKARATKLTERHIYPNNFQKMSVKLATQVFSNKTFSAMSAVFSKQLTKEAKRWFKKKE